MLGPEDEKMRLPRFLRSHEWYHGTTRIWRISDIPDGSLFYRLDCHCGCERSIDGAALKQIVKDKPSWLTRTLGFKHE